MIKTPLKKVNKSYTTVLFMWFLMLLVYVSLLLFVFPCKFTFLKGFIYSVPIYGELVVLFVGLICVDIFGAYDLYV